MRHNAAAWQIYAASHDILGLSMGLSKALDLANFAFISSSLIQTFATVFYYLHEVMSSSSDKPSPLGIEMGSPSKSLPPVASPPPTNVRPVRVKKGCNTCRYAHHRDRR
jgi:hypothetical protein